MHPIERLRAVARAEGVPQDRLVAEAATALSAFSSQPAAMLTAARQVVARQVTAGGMWSLAATMLAADDPWTAASDVIDAIDRDAAAGSLEYAVGDYGTVVVDDWSPTLAGVLLGDDAPATEVIDADDRGDRLRALLNSRGVDVRVWDPDAVEDLDDRGPLGPFVTECAALSPTAMLVAAGTELSIDTVSAARREVWVVGGVGRLLPPEMFDALAARAELEGALDEQALEVVDLAGVDRVFGPWGERRPAELARLVDCPVAPELYRAPRG